MSNKKLNIKSERLSRSLYISDEFYKPGVDKVIGKVYRNSHINTYSAPMEGEYPKYILHNASTQAWNLQNWCKLPSQFNTYTDPYRPGENPYSLTPFCWIPDEGSDIDKNLGTAVAATPSSSYILNILQSYESGVVMAYATPSPSGYDNAYCCVDCTYVFKLMTAEEFYHYIEEISSPEYDALRAELKNSDGSFCQNDYFAVSLDSEYSHLIYDSPTRMTITQGEYIIYSSRDFWPQSACYQSYWWPLDEYNGLPDLNKIDMNATDFTIIDDNYETTFGWYWDGLRWQPFSSEEALKADEVEEIVNNMSLTNVTSGAFRLPEVDIAEVLQEYDVYQSGDYYIATCPYIRWMKIPNFNPNYIYAVVQPNGNNLGLDMGWNNEFNWSTTTVFTLEPGGAEYNIYSNRTNSNDDINLKIGIDGYLYISLRFSWEYSSGATLSAESIISNCTNRYTLSRLILIPQIRTDSYKCNLKNYMSSTIMSLVDTEAGQGTYADNLKDICLFSTRSLSSASLGYGDYRYSFSLRFTPKATGTYTVLFGIVPSSASTAAVRCNAGITNAPTSVADYNGRALDLTGTSGTPFFAGFQITCDADVPQYIHINSTGGYFSLMYFEIYGLPTLNTTDEGAQIPTNNCFIKNVYYNARSYSVSTSNTALSNTMSTNSLYGWSMTPEIWEVDTTA